jgi:ADP-ribose pyrophosphatase YjhB (NUDIX family)
MSNDLNNSLQMYKVFLNQQCLFVGTCFTTTDLQAGIQVNGSDTVLVSKLLADFLKLSLKSDLYICVKSDNEAWQFLKNEFKVIQAAGGVVLNQACELLVMSRLGFWDLPKGKIDRGETPTQAALREVGEECGLKQLRIQRALPCSYHLYQSPHHANRWILKQTHWFLMSAPGNEPLVPELAEDIEHVEWAGTQRVRQIIGGTYPSLQPLFQGYLNSEYSI